MKRTSGPRRDTDKARAFANQRSELKRGPWTRGGYEGPEGRAAGPPPRKPLKRSQPKRDWSEARAKVEREEVCRLGRDGGCRGRLEAAHVIGRDRDQFPPVAERHEYRPWEHERILIVRSIRIVPLCTRHHKLYDAHEADLLGFLTPEEEAQAVLDADGLEAARRRLCPSAYREAAA